MLGFRKSDQCAELVHILRGPVEKSTDWSTPLFIAQVDFARAYDSVLHSAVIRAMTRRGIPPPVLAAYVRDTGGTELVFEHGGWRTVQGR